MSQLSYPKDQESLNSYQLRNIQGSLLNSNCCEKRLDNNHNIQIYQFNDNIDDDPDEQYCAEREILNDNSTKKFIENSIIVPTMSNVDDVFQLLSQKIAKYCQVLADLTNCEVFYKAQLPLNNDTSKKQSLTNKFKTKESTRKIRSLYWGTHQMLFEYSHNEGLKYNKAMGDCLIKINQRSMTNDVSTLIEEILNEPNLYFKQDDIDKNQKADQSDHESLSEFENYDRNKLSNINMDEQNRDVEFKDCVININRLNESTFNKYLNKFESTNNKINSINNRHVHEYDLGLPEDIELYSDKIRLKSDKLNGTKNDLLIKSIFMNDSGASMEQNSEYEEDNEEEDEDDDLDEKDLLVKNCFDLNQNEEECYSCEHCKEHFFKHLTQLKIHQLRVHQNIQIPDDDTSHFECLKCKLKYFHSRIDFIKHILLCYYPDIYSCKTCKLSFPNYSQYLFHSKYVHTNVVYMCSICGRKYREIKDLLDHDQLMHSKSYVYCELCFEQLKSKQKLLEHYKACHLTETDSIEILETINQSRIKSVEKPESNCNNTSIQSQSKQQQVSLIKDNAVANEKIELTPSLSEISKDDKAQNQNQSWNKIQKNDLIRGLIDRKHQCKWCSLRFYTKSQLKQHETTHTNSVLYCPVCDKEFTHKDRLSGHMKCHMEPSLECKVCGKKFKRLCNLYNHELVHGLTEHAFMLCQFCGRGFRSRRDYQNHVIANHRDQLMKSDSSNQIESISTKDNDEIKKTPKKIIKNQNRNTNIRTNPNSQTGVYNVSNTTTFMLSDEYISLNDDNELINRKDKYSPEIDLDDQSETYFTRTDTIQIRKHANSRMIGENDLDDVSSEHFESFNSAQNSSKHKDIFKEKNSLTKNKIKRLKATLDVEVIDDDINDVHNTSSSSSFMMNQFV